MERYRWTFEIGHNDSGAPVLRVWSNQGEGFYLPLTAEQLATFIEPMVETLHEIGNQYSIKVGNPYSVRIPA